MSSKQIGLAVAAVASLSLVMIGGNELARSGSPGTLTAATIASGGSSDSRADHRHTPVTGSELAKVKAAVKAKDPAVTVRGARQDADGSYDVFGTKAGRPVMVEVSKDLETVTEHTGRFGRPGIPGGPRGRWDHGSAVTGSGLAKVKSAIRAKDAGVTVRGVRQDDDGSYHAFGTKAGRPVVLEVSKDLETVTEHTGVPGRPGMRGGPHGPGLPGGPHGRWDHGSAVTGSELARVKAAVRAKDAGVTVLGVRQDDDGSYHAFGMQAGKPVLLEVTKDLRTVTEHRVPMRAPGTSRVHGWGSGSEPRTSGSSI